MSMQSDLRNPELGYFDEGMNLTDASSYGSVCREFGQASILPPVSYRSKVFSELENEKVWTRSWVAVGLLQQIPNPGDLLPFTIGFHGIHVQRNRDGTILARMNRHQHGGCRFVPEQCRTGTQTKCTITSCNYTRDSDVMSAGENGENTDLMYKFIGQVPERLAPVKCETWGPFIFVNLDPACGPLADYLGHLTDQIGPCMEGHLTLKAKKWLDFQCNWKIAGAVFTGVARPPAGPPQVVGEDGSATYAQAVVPADIGIEDSGDAAPQILSGKPASPLEDMKLFWLFPNVLLVVGRRHLAITLLQATGAGKCLYRFFLLTSESGANDVNDEGTRAVLYERWLSFLRANGAAAEAMYRDAVQWGTSNRPGTAIRDLPVEENYSSYLLNRFLVSKIRLEHRYYWNAPIMDAAMTMRR